jgi:hypothetical protein
VGHLISKQVTSLDDDDDNNDDSDWLMPAIYFSLAGGREPTIDALCKRSGGVCPAPAAE